MKAFEVESVGIYNSKIARPGTEISEKRKTDMFELELPMEVGGVSYIDSEFSPISNDVFICARPGMLRHTRFPFKCRYIHLKVFDEGVRRELVQLPPFIKIKNRSVYTVLFDELQECYAKTEAHEGLMVQSLVLKLIYKLRKESAENAVGNAPAVIPAVAAALDFISENLTERLTLECVAKQVSVSPIHFHNIFKRSVGKTLHDYIESERIKKSVNLMLSTDMTLAEIAYNCGFSSQSYFNSVFRRKKGVTPRRYVKEINDRYRI